MTDVKTRSYFSLFVSLKVHFWSIMKIAFLLLSKLDVNVQISIYKNNS